MMTIIELKKQNLHCKVIQMYDYLKLTFFLGMPFDMDFTIDLEPEDIDEIVIQLLQGKKELIQARKDRKEIK